MAKFVEFKDVKGSKFVVNVSDIVFMQEMSRDVKLYIRNYHIFHHHVSISFAEFEKLSEQLTQMKCHHEATAY